jgi:hypothetical protein
MRGRDVNCPAIRQSWGRRWGDLGLHPHLRGFILRTVFLRYETWDIHGCACSHCATLRACACAHCDTSLAWSQCDTSRSCSHCDPSRARAHCGISRVCAHCDTTCVCVHIVTYHARVCAHCDTSRFFAYRATSRAYAHCDITCVFTLWHVTWVRTLWHITCVPTCSIPRRHVQKNHEPKYVFRRIRKICEKGLLASSCLSVHPSLCME